MYCMAERVVGKLGVLVEAGRRARVCYPVRWRPRDLRILCWCTVLCVLVYCYFFYALQLTSDVIFRGCVWMRGYTPSLLGIWMCQRAVSGSFRSYAAAYGRQSERPAVTTR
ncbi:hypothetical protein HETIRDRAFT_330630 [Heterobasidion irregulare TC 32-1]|uniref:Uncharacterized protein n=1 Tax=Heterobasidion irregulare (strain TC 32-1) TaxID=747525 RepID=W4JPS8_HETIT|nr:uncharacterized protein HETIRDRAFT_330630 [Heterobasidion irregulare TC 32-1]ETW75474.1 hypothetical protein HETIRDRAFT_330630 [Heterobasidion irregulare TC 32-1]